MNLRRRLYLISLVASPIIGIYGTSPFYIFDKMALDDFLKINIGLAVSIFFAFSFYIETFFRIPRLNNFWRFVFTYILNFSLRLFIVYFITPLVPFKPPIDETYIAYPVLTSFGVNGIIMIICNSIITGYKRAQAELEVQELKYQNNEAQKQVLIQQLHPHFLFNSLSVLKSLIGENPADAKKYVVKLSEFLRYSLQANQSNTTSLRKELNFVHDYIELQKLRFGDSFNFNMDIPDALLDHLLPVLALQTLVENIFKHNSFTQENPLIFSIRAFDDKIEVKNNRLLHSSSDKTGIGLENLALRYQLISSRKMEVISDDEFFCVRIPLINI